MKERANCKQVQYKYELKENRSIRHTKCTRIDVWGIFARLRATPY